MNIRGSVCREVGVGACSCTSTDVGVFVFCTKYIKFIYICIWNIKTWKKCMLIFQQVLEFICKGISGLLIVNTHLAWCSSIILAFHVTINCCQLLITPIMAHIYVLLIEFGLSLCPKGHNSVYLIVLISPSYFSPNSKPAVGDTNPLRNQLVSVAWRVRKRCVQGVECIRGKHLGGERMDFYLTILGNSVQPCNGP